MDEARVFLHEELEEWFGAMSVRDRAPPASLARRMRMQAESTAQMDDYIRRACERLIDSLVQQVEQVVYNTLVVNGLCC